MDTYSDKATGGVNERVQNTTNHADVAPLDTRPSKRARLSADSRSRNDIVSSNNDTSPTIPDLVILLDFTDPALSNLASIANRFDQIASLLLHHFHIYLSTDGGNTKELFEILEIEFYLHKDECHEDPFTHGAEEQRRSGQWYFHRAPRRANHDSSQPRTTTAAGGFRGGTRKGLDLTIGASSSLVYTSSPYFNDNVPAGTFSEDKVDNDHMRGGILFRSLLRVSDSSVISGPSLLVDEILRISGATNISELVTQKWDGDIKAFSASSTSSCKRKASMYLVPISSSLIATTTKTTIYRSPRIGLDLAHSSTTTSATDPRVNFLARAYRYFTRPVLLTANGRAQTFIGIYDELNSSGKFANDANMASEIVQLTGIKLATVEKYIREYTGERRCVISQCVSKDDERCTGAPRFIIRLDGACRLLTSRSLLLKLYQFHSVHSKAIQGLLYSNIPHSIRLCQELTGNFTMTIFRPASGACLVSVDLLSLLSGGHRKRHGNKGHM